MLHIGVYSRQINTRREKGAECVSLPCPSTDKTVSQSPCGILSGYWASPGPCECAEDLRVDWIPRCMCIGSTNGGYIPHHSNLQPLVNSNSADTNPNLTRKKGEGCACPGEVA